MLNAHLSSSPGRTYILSATSADIVVVSDTEIKSPATSAKRYAGFGHGSCHSN